MRVRRVAVQSKRLYDTGLDGREWSEDAVPTDPYRALSLDAIHQLDDVFKQRFVSIWLDNIAVKD